MTIEEYVAKNRKVDVRSKRQMSCKALLVDCTGTLVDSYDAETALLVEVACKYGRSKFEVADFERYWHCTTSELMKLVMKDKKVGNFEELGELAAAEFMDRYDEVLKDCELVNPCTSKIVAVLKAKTGAKAAIVSSAEKPILDKVSNYFGFEGAVLHNSHDSA